MIADLPTPAPVVGSVYSYEGALGHMTLRSLDDNRHFRVLFHSPSPEFVRRSRSEFAGARDMVGWMVHCEETARLVKAVLPIA